MGKILKPNELDPSLMRHACIAAAGFLTGISILDKDEMIAVLREAVTTPAKDAAELSTLRAENERLRERCEAAEKAVAFFFECQIAIQLPGGNADETFGFEALRDGRFAVTKWVGARQFFHIRDTPMEAFQDAITDNWLPASNNNGGESRK